ncbi:hypothetical protein Pla110_37610 [Polystyrenella longa]|uniref:DNA mimic protein DMP19 C-terminal domain-containing protein n=1 Tax=Polystyrenella longa TaxID=2528007 RepID=A0A518CS05_9PLAN|nr:DUF4375 domain-containing protein [Polystyrenella longa]QDU82009.1 hypothetical protein Pla110_37610 [Polystyrenella longa]
MIYLLIALSISFVLFVINRVTINLNRSRKSEGEYGGFRDWVKNPEMKNEYAEFMESQQAAKKSLRVPENISDRDIEKLVNRLFIEDDHDFNYDKLQLIGKKAVPFLMKALQNQRVAKRFNPNGFKFGSDTPLQRICSLLIPHDANRAVKILTRFIDHEDNYVRKYAALEISEHGTGACIPTILKALDDEDDYVRSHTMIGIRNGIREGTNSKEFLTGIFPGLIKLLNRKDRSVGGEAPRLLLDIDTDKAVPILLSSNYFTIENSQLHYIIMALNEAEYQIPRVQLLPLMNQLKHNVDKYPHDYEYAEALHAYAFNPDQSAEQYLRNDLNSPHKKVQEAAARAIGILEGITEPFNVILETKKESGFEGLTKQQKFYYAVFMYDAEVRNGGHAQYFVNSTGNNWKTAYAGLKAIGASSRVTILRNALSLFGKAGPSEDNDLRHEQLADFSQKQEDILDKLNDEYYDCQENTEMLLALFAIAHKRHFIADD